MQQDYKLNFKISAETKALDNLSNKATQAERKFFGLGDTIKGMGSTVGNLAMSLTGLGAALGTINIVNNAIETTKKTKANIVDFQKHTWGSQHIVKFSDAADKISRDYKLDREDVFGAMYHATQNRRAFDSGENEIVEWTKLMARYGRKTGREAGEVSRQMLRIKKMGSFSTNKMVDLLDMITAYEDEYGMVEADSLKALEDNWQYLSDNTDPENFINAYKDLLEKIGDPSSVNRAVRTLLIKMQEMKKGMNIKDSALGQLLDKKGISAERFKKGDFADATKLLFSSIDSKDEKDMVLLSEALGSKEALKLQDVKITALDKPSYQNNLTGELEKVDLKEDIIDKTKYQIKRKGSDFVRMIVKKDTFSLWSDEPEQQLYTESLKKQGLYKYQIDAKLVEKFKQDTLNTNKTKYEIKQKENNSIGIIDKNNTHSLQNNEKKQRLYDESLKNQRLYNHQIDSQTREKFKQETTTINNDNKNVTVENTFIINEATDAEAIAKASAQAVGGNLKVLDNTLKDRNNLNNK